MRSGRTRVEGVDLYYEVRGDGGSPVLLIPGANGDGDSYAAVADLLCDEFTVITYDRRANARSVAAGPINFEMSQQARDVAAVLDAAHQTGAAIVGSSSGGAIALAFALAFPHATRALIIHEPPLARLHPKSRRWQRFFAGVYQTSLWLGPAIGGIRFIVGIRVPVRRLVAAHRQAVRYAQDHPIPGPIQPRVSAADGIRVLLSHELLPVTNFLPDLDELRARQTLTVVAVSEMALEKSTWLAVITRVLSDRLACQLSVAPGHHGSYEDVPDEWAAWLRTTLRNVQPPGSA